MPIDSANFSFSPNLGILTIIKKDKIFNPAINYNSVVIEVIENVWIYHIHIFLAEMLTLTY